MSEILVLKMGDDSVLNKEHNSALDSLKMFSFKTANKELTDAKLAHLVDGADAADEHIHDARYFREDEHINASAGVGSAGKPTVLDARGKIDPSMIAISDYAHDSMSGVAASTVHTAFPLLVGGRNFTAIQSYDAHKLFTLDAEIIDKKYVDDTVNAAVSALISGTVWKDFVQYATNMAITTGVTTAQNLQDHAETENTHDFAAGEFVLSFADNKIYKIGIGANKSDRLLTVVTGSSSTVDGDRTQAAVNGHARFCQADLTDSPAGQENQSVYIFSGSFKKMADVDWAFADGIDLKTGYNRVQAVIVAGMSVQAAISSLDYDVYAIKGYGISSSDATITTSGTIGANNLDVKINFSTTFDDAKAVKASDLAAVDTNTKGSDIIGVNDTLGIFTATKLTGVLNEIWNKAKEGSGVEYTAASALAKGDLVYISGNNSVAKLTDLTQDHMCVGLVAEAVGLGQPVKTVNIDSAIAGILAGATANTPMYWTGTGFSSSAPTGAGVNIWMVGMAKNVTDLSVMVKHLRKRP